MVKKKTKFGKLVTLYLSHEAIAKLKKLTDNKSTYIERLINREFENAKRE